MKRLKLSLISIFVMIMLVISLVGCNMYDDDVTVVLENQGVVQETYTISLFRNAVISGVEHNIPAGQDFLGWAFEKDALEPDLEGGAIVRYMDVKDYVRNEVIVLYAVFGEKIIVTHDLVIGWYDKESTSGLNQTLIDQFETALKAHLATLGLNVAELDIVIKGYEGDVAGSCADIMADGNVSLLLGWGGNLTSTGGIATISRASGIVMGGKNRYIDLIAVTDFMVGDTDLATLVFNWSSTDDAALASFAGK